MLIVDGKLLMVCGLKARLTISKIQFTNLFSRLERVSRLKNLYFKRFLLLSIKSIYQNLSTKRHLEIVVRVKLQFAFRFLTTQN